MTEEATNNSDSPIAESELLSQDAPRNDGPGESLLAADNAETGDTAGAQTEETPAESQETVTAPGASQADSQNAGDTTETDDDSGDGPANDAEAAEAIHAEAIAEAEKPTPLELLMRTSGLAKIRAKAVLEGMNDEEKAKLEEDPNAAYGMYSFRKNQEAKAVSDDDSDAELDGAGENGTGEGSEE